jgi:hypothetical protein
MANKPTYDFLTPKARIVNGHPMIDRSVVDDRTGEVKFRADKVTPRSERYFAVAIPKTGVDWKQTDWGRFIETAAKVGYPQGQYQQPQFSWKVADGDSAIPNKKGNKPVENEGWAGHWVLHLKTELDFPCHHIGKHEPIMRIRNENEIKCGDYVRVFISAVDNAPSESPGVYLNPLAVEVLEPGAQIISKSSVDVAKVFGGSGGAVHQAPPPANMPAPPPPTNNVQPAHDLIPAPPPPAPAKRMAPGCQFTYEALVQSGYSDAQMIQAGYLLP